MWADISPDMMSDEEFDENEKTYIRHPPSYRSEILNKFIARLDARGDQQRSNHPRMKRRLGSPVPQPSPKSLKHWAKKGALSEDFEQSNELYYSDDSDDIMSQYKS